MKDKVKEVFNRVEIKAVANGYLVREDKHNYSDPLSYNDAPVHVFISFKDMAKYLRTKLPQF